MSFDSPSVDGQLSSSQEKKEPSSPEEALSSLESRITKAPVPTAANLHAALQGNASLLVSQLNEGGRTRFVLTPRALGEQKGMILQNLRTISGLSDHQITFDSGRILLKTPDGKETEILLMRPRAPASYRLLVSNLIQSTWGTQKSIEELTGLQLLPGDPPTTFVSSLPLATLLGPLTRGGGLPEGRAFQRTPEGTIRFLRGGQEEGVVVTGEYVESKGIKLAQEARSKLSVLLPQKGRSAMSLREYREKRKQILDELKMFFKNRAVNILLFQMDRDWKVRTRIVQMLIGHPVELTEKHIVALQQAYVRGGTIDNVQFTTVRKRAEDLLGLFTSAEVRDILESGIVAPPPVTYEATIFHQRFVEWFQKNPTMMVEWINKTGGMNIPDNHQEYLRRIAERARQCGLPEETYHMIADDLLRQVGRLLRRPDMTLERFQEEVGDYWATVEEQAHAAHILSNPGIVVDPDIERMRYQLPKDKQRATLAVMNAILARFFGGSQAILKEEFHEAQQRLLDALTVEFKRPMLRLQKQIYLSLPKEKYKGLSINEIVSRNKNNSSVS